MEYYAIYTRTPRGAKPGGKVMVVHHGIHSLLDVMEDDHGIYYAQENRIIRPGAIKDADVYSVELSLCTNDISEGDKCIVRDHYREAHVVEKIGPETVHFKTGTPKNFSRKDTFKKVAVVSENVNFLNNGDIVPSSYVSFVVVSEDPQVQTKAILTPNAVTLKKTEQIVALITCSKCGLKM